MLTSARPRTLVLAIWDAVIDVAMIAPRGHELGIRQVLPITAEPAAVWAAIEELGEFDRITLVGEDVRGLAAGIADQSQRPLRQMSRGALRWSHLIEGHGVEVALALGARFTSTVFFDGIELAGVDLGQLRVRKSWRLREYLAPEVFERKGTNAWRKRVSRTIRELVAVWNPTALYLAAPPTLPMPELVSPVTVMLARNSLAESLRVWDVEPEHSATLRDDMLLPH